jgi:hypothetical protein
MRLLMAHNVWGFVQWPIRDPGSRAAKSRSWVKYRFLDQISIRPCQPDMSLGFILSLSIYSDGHCTKPDVMCSYYFQRINVTSKNKIATKK